MKAINQEASLSICTNCVLPLKGEPTGSARRISMVISIRSKLLSWKNQVVTNLTIWFLVITQLWLLSIPMEMVKWDSILPNPLAGLRRLLVEAGIRLISRKPTRPIAISGFLSPRFFPGRIKLSSMGPSAGCGGFRFYSSGEQRRNGVLLMVIWSEDRSSTFLNSTSSKITGARQKVIRTLSFPSWRVTSTIHPNS